MPESGQRLRECKRSPRSEWEYGPTTKLFLGIGMEIVAIERNDRRHFELSTSGGVRISSISQSGDLTDSPIAARPELKPCARLLV